MNNRPVFATDDPVLAEGLRDHIPIWEPGGELAQFRPLIEQLQVQEIRPSDAELIEPMYAYECEKLSDFFRSAILQLKEDLGRNDPQLAESARMPWDCLTGFIVCICPSLNIGVTIRQGNTSEVYDIEVAAKADSRRCALFVRSPSELCRVDGGGRALSALFGGDPRRLSQAWLAACDIAKTGIQAQPVELAAQRARRDREQNELELEKRTTAFQLRTAERHRVRHSNRSGGVTSTSLGSADSRDEDDKAAERLRSPRALVNPESLMLVDPEGRIAAGSGRTQGNVSHDRKLVEPRLGANGPVSRSLLRGYSDLDKEAVGKDLLAMLLGSDLDEMADLRAQMGVGADAIDEMGRYFELKVSAGPEPDSVRLTNSEVKRALSTPDFFLVVVSGVEGVDARPTVRVILDPLKQLQPTDSGAVTLSGVRSVKSLVYDFAPVDSEVDSTFGGLSRAE